MTLDIRSRKLFMTLNMLNVIKIILFLLLHYRITNQYKKWLLISALKRKQILFMLCLKNVSINLLT